VSLNRRNPATPLPRGQRAVLSIFIAFNIVATTLWAAPIRSRNVRRRRPVNGVAWYLQWAGLGMGWAFFAPDPIDTYYYVTSEITYRDGRKDTWKFPGPEDVGVYQRYFMGTYTAWSSQIIPLSESAPLWPDAARYVARLHNHPENPPTTVKLIRHWKTTELPGSKDLSNWSEYEFFTYSVESKDLE